jgi:nitrite reductase (NADH) small subunit
MRLVKLDPLRTALLEMGDRRFVLVSPRGQATLLVDAVCPHRGGPLHLGRLESDAGILHCPWHGRRVSLRLLERTALPLVRWRDAAVAVVPEETDEPEAAPGQPRLRLCAELCDAS